MQSDQQLIEEIKKLNSKLDKLASQNNLFRSAFSSFTSGFLHSLGSLIGTTILIILAFFLMSKINYSSILNDWLQSFTSQIQWEKIIPQPKIIDLKDLNLNNRNPDSL